MKLDSKKDLHRFPEGSLWRFFFLAEQFIQSLQKACRLPLVFGFPIEAMSQIPPCTIRFGEGEISCLENTVFVRQVLQCFSYL